MADISGRLSYYKRAVSSIILVSVQVDQDVEVDA